MTGEEYAKHARRLISFFTDFHTVVQEINGECAWFLGGKLNLSTNCLDRHKSSNVAVVYVHEETKKITYGELLIQVSKLANGLRDLGVRKGDVVAIYLPMIPEAIVSMLACVRIGALHSVVFSGFSAAALQDRINDANCKLLITTDTYLRLGKQIDLLLQVRQINIKKIILNKQSILQENELDFHKFCSKYRSYCEPEWMSSEDPSFVLYTSGSTGKPKGVVHSTAGYLLGAMMTTETSFQFGFESGVMACTADVGWITGHTYLCYGPLSFGATTILFGGSPLEHNLWKTLSLEKATVFYTSPTVLRVLKSKNEEQNAKKFEFHLKVIGTVGESIDPETWEWTQRIANVPVVDTYWQTETGSHVIAPVPYKTKLKPASATLPCFGMNPVLLDQENNEIKNEGKGLLCFRGCWPSMARTILGNHQRFQTLFLKDLYVTGDIAERDQDGYYWIRGRVDDVLNVAGHRLSTAEIESCILSTIFEEKLIVSECAVVGKHDETTGQQIVAFVTISMDVPCIKDVIQRQVRTGISPIAIPKQVIVCENLPKTRSGKILRRVLRHILNNEPLGDLTTLEDLDSIKKLIN